MSEGKKYVIDLFDVKSFEQLEKDLDGLEEALQSEEFMRFLADKCLIELDNIIQKNSSGSEYTPQMPEYSNNNKSTITSDKITIYNDSMVDLSHVSSNTLINYPDGLSLAKLIEFGTGIPRNK